VLQAGRPEVPSQSVPRGRRLIVEILQVGVLALVLFLVIHLVVQPVRVIGSSMYTTLSDQDYLLATTIDYRFHPPERGDIVILKDPYNPSLDFIKRVIAVPGERLLIRGGHVYVNGRLLTEPYVNHQEPWTENADWPVGGGRGGQGAVIPPNEYFVMGDNRNHSSDSRAFGPVPRNSIEARGWLRVLPVTQFGLVDREKPSLDSTVSAPAA
jgi:signal peptidase I